ncbi:MAG TPA: polymorphic toxin-type HINT domain-containing protein [Microlunatus sp.]|nr:polymorphic toxin-type HINT domain-containing protein [Microlunatus sp.]
MSESAHEAGPAIERRVQRGRRSSDPQRPGPSDGLIRLQRSVGNAAVSALIRRRLRAATAPRDELLGPDTEPATTPPAIAVQRAPGDPRTAFAERWIHEHPTLGNADFTLIAALPADQRDAVLAVVRSRYGQEYIRRGRAGSLPDKEPDAKPANPLNAEDYWKKYGRANLDAALQRVESRIDFEITGPGLTFPTSECSAFAHYALVGRLQRLDAADVSQLLDTDLLALINGVRILDDLDRGPDAYEPGVTERIVERIGLGLRRATSRLALPYALARAKAIQDARAQAVRAGSQPGPVISSDPTALIATQPTSGSLGAQTTIEHATAEAMTSGRFVEFDEAVFGIMYVPQAVGEPRPTELELERGSGTWKIARVVKPAGATAAEVANALFGTPENAQLVVGRGDRFAFSFPASRMLAEPYDTVWREHIEADEGGGPLDLIRGRVPSDPVLELDEAGATRRALDSAADRPADGDQQAVLQRFEIIRSLLASISAAAEPLGVAGSVQPMAARVTERMAGCAGDPAEAQKWSAHSSGQLALLAEAKTGFDAITQQMFAAGLPAVSTADGEQLAGDVTAAMQGPTVELTAAYARVVAASDQLDVATGRLVSAKERLAAYPFDMADRMLAMIRKRIAALDGYATIATQSYSRGRLDALQAEISAQVADLRVAVVNGDGTASNRLAELKTQLAMLDLQSTVGATISLIQDLKNTLNTAESWSPDTGRQYDLYNTLQDAMQPWMQLGIEYDELWQAGRERDENTMASIRRRVEALRKGTPLPPLIQQVASFQEDEAKRQRIIAIGIMIAAALVAAVTGGLASGAIGGMAGAIVGAGLEALTFTAITSTLDADQTFGGFMAELGINFATFGGLRAISGTAKLLAAAEKLSIAGTAAEMTVEGLWMVAATKAGEEIRERIGRGETMSTQTAATIFGHQMLISFAGRVIARGVSALAGARTGIAHLEEIQAYLTKQQEAEKLARAFLAKGDDSMGAALVRADTEVLRAEVRARQRMIEIASNPKQAKTFGLELSAAELGKLKAATEAASRELTVREINALMQQVEIHADHGVAEPVVYAELVQKHRQLGSTVVEGIDAAGSPKARIAPLASDGTFGPPFTLHSRLGADVEGILAQKGLQSSSVIHDYLVERGGNRAAAIADLNKVKSPAELNALMEKTLANRTAKLRETDGCFVAGTLVHGDHGLRPIETLAVGDLVLATDPGTGRSGLCPVIATSRHDDRSLVRVQLAETSIECTPSHPFWVDRRGWLTAGALDPEAVLLGLGGSRLSVTQIRELDARATVYNLTVGGRHTYHVCADGVLVHNKPIRKIILPPAVVQVRDALDVRLVTLNNRVTRLRGQAGEIPSNRTDRVELIRRSDQLDERVQQLRDDLDDASTVDEFNRVLRPEAEQAEAAFTALQAEINATWVPRPTVAEQVQIDAYTVALGNLRAAIDAGDVAAQAASRTVLDGIEARARGMRNIPASDLSRLQDHIATLTRQRELMDTGGAYGIFGQQIPCQAVQAAAGLRGLAYYQIETQLGVPVRDLGTSAPIDQPGRVRLVWDFGDGSQLSVDVPGKANDSAWQISREAHLGITAPPPNGTIHLSQEGIAVPDASAPAHLPIREDRLLKARVRGDMRPRNEVLP